MYTYRIVIDGYDARPIGARSARVVTYSRGYNRQDALRRIGSIRIAQDGTVSDGINVWPGTRNLPAGSTQARSLTCWSVVTMRSVKTAGTPAILAEYVEA